MKGARGATRDRPHGGPAERRHRAEGAKRELFVRRIEDMLALPHREAEALVRQPVGRAVRINPLAGRPAAEVRAELEALGAELTSIPWCPDAFFLESEKGTVAESAAFREGRVYLQNAASFIPALALDPQPGEAILDVCAAPGGKAAHLAALAGNDLHLHVNDSIKPRQEKLRQVLGTLGVKYEALTGHPGQYIDKYVERRFDRILLDAQCSGEGMENLDEPWALAHWSLERITQMSFLQKKMLAAAWKLLKPGGTLVYSTCTFAPEENEEPVDHLLRHKADATVAPIALDLPERRPGLAGFSGKRFDPRLQDALRIVPDRHLEAFFVCKLVKAEGSE